MSGNTKDLRKCLQLIVINKQTQKLTPGLQDKIATSIYKIFNLLKLKMVFAHLINLIVNLLN